MALLGGARAWTASAAGSGIVLAALSWALSGLAPVLAQSNGVPDEKTLEDELLKKKPATPPPVVKPAKGTTVPANAQRETPKPSAGRAPIMLVVESDAACALEVNGDRIAALEPGAAKKLPVPPGDQLVKCVSTEEPGEVYSAVQNIKVGEQKVVVIALASRIAAIRLKRDEEAQRAAAEDALWSKASQSLAPAELQAYLDKYPDGRHAEQARAGIGELAQRAAEDADWKNVASSTQLAPVRSFIDRYPAGRYLDAALERVDFINHLPPRPALPFSLDESAWEELENSVFYGALPKRSQKVTVQMSMKVRNQPPKGLSTSWTVVTTREILPLGDRCVMFRTDTRSTAPGDAQTNVVDDYRCGSLTLGTLADGKLVRTASRSDVATFLAEDESLRKNPPCDLKASISASIYHSALTGAAIRFGCDKGDYFLSDLGVWLYELGEMDPEKRQYVVPNPGYHYETATDGVPGGKTTTVYERYSWTPGN